MSEFLKIEYGIPRIGGPDQLPPPVIWRPGFGAEPSGEPMDFPFIIPMAPLKAQVLIEDGMLAPFRDDGDLSGNITAEAAVDMRLRLDTPAVNGVYVTGSCSYTIRNADMELCGDCINDFAGNGAAVQVMKNARVVVENSKIITCGVLRSCLVADEYSTLEVHGCELICEGGVPAPDNPAWAIPAGPGMIKAPDVMKCKGHSRLALTVGNAHAYYNHCRIVSDGWAALSTDASWGGTYLEANHCNITLKNAGYAAFADEGAMVVLNDCDVKTPSHAGMICGKAIMAFHQCRITAGFNAVWMFAVQGLSGSQIANLNIYQSEIETDGDALLVTGTNAHIEVRGSKLYAKSGVILRGKSNQKDPMTTKINPGEPLYGIKAIFTDMDVNGDFIHEDPDRAMILFFTHAHITGAINGAAVKMDPATTWFSPKDSAICLTQSIDLGQVDAPDGVTITITCPDMAALDGKKLPSGGILAVK